MDTENNSITRNTIIPDYEVSIGDKQPFRVRLEGIIVEISDVSLTLPEEKSNIDNALFSYTYTVIDGELNEDDEPQFKQWLNLIVSGELNDYVNG